MLEPSSPLDRPLHGAPQLLRVLDEANALKEEMRASGAQHASRALRHAENLNLVLIVLAAGASMTDHNAPAPETVTVLQGTARFSTEHGQVEARAGDVVGCDAHAPHTIEAQDECVLLLHVGPKPDAH